MNRISLDNQQVTIQIFGWDKLWSFKRKVIFDQNNIIQVFKYDKSISPPWLKSLGTAIPGIIIAGTYQNFKNRQEFWSTRFNGNTIAIDLQREKYNRVVCDLPQDQSVDEWIAKLTIN
ncbi:MAG: hypothetical protein KME09_26105 [Pleurocapsa minor HA4230-MV1]|jgi:hypothetical protein|nr:hypothetical protein [Pleurocapsa minor HA4230-MV1]